MNIYQPKSLNMFLISIVMTLSPTNIIWIHLLNEHLPSFNATSMAPHMVYGVPVRRKDATESTQLLKQRTNGTATGTGSLPAKNRCWYRKTQRNWARFGLNVGIYSSTIFVRIWELWITLMNQAVNLCVSVSDESTNNCWFGFAMTLRKSPKRIWRAFFEVELWWIYPDSCLLTVPIFGCWNITLTIENALILLQWFLMIYLRMVIVYFDCIYRLLLFLLLLFSCLIPHIL